MGARMGAGRHRDAALLTTVHLLMLLLGAGAASERQLYCHEPSLTTVNGGQKTCRGELLFQDTFEGPGEWSSDVHIAGGPEFEFVVYDKNNGITFSDDGMIIRASLTEDLYGPGFVSNGTMSLRECTSMDPELCQRTAFSYNILPPVVSGRVHTANSFSFRYGLVEMEVRGPRGDWLYPELTLKPVKPRYGPNYGSVYPSGEIRLLSHLGNQFLRQQIGGSRSTLSGSIIFGPDEPFVFDLAEKYNGTSQCAAAIQALDDWSLCYNTVNLKWSPDGFEFWVNGGSVKKLTVPPGGFASLAEGPLRYAWNSGGPAAPFDEEFYLSIGLGVGGLDRFLDDVTNGLTGELPKPWKNTSPKAMLNFWKAKDQWYPTWESPELRVSYVKRALTGSSACDLEIGNPRARLWSRWPTLHSAGALAGLGRAGPPYPPLLSLSALGPCRAGL